MDVRVRSRDRVKARLYRHATELMGRDETPGLRFPADTDSVVKRAQQHVWNLIYSVGRVGLVGELN